MALSARPERLVVFDGYCNVCSGWARFLKRHRVEPPFRLIPMQSPEGRALFGRHKINPDDPLTFLVIDRGKAYVQSDATIHLLAEAGGAWRIIRLARFAPRALRDGLYLLVARNRYQWFGRRETCFLPESQSEGGEAQRKPEKRGSL
jgi:predicted DCC family thiol-disulfide oxidoreductase YuxK